MENSKLNCDIFLCYRGTHPMLAKNFKVYADSITNSVDDKRDFGNIWYSDFVAEGRYTDDKALEELIFSAKYFIVFYFHGFFDDFFMDEEHKVINPDCVTAKEFYYAEKARCENNLKFIIVNMDLSNFGDSERSILHNFFEIKNILRSDTVSAFADNNLNHHVLRQGNDILFYERLLESIYKLNSAKEIVEFGSYPQKFVSNSLLYGTLTELAGGVPMKDNFGNWKSYKYFYNGNRSDIVLYTDICYENEKYRGVYFFELRPFLTIGKKSYLSRLGCKTNKIYWFKYDPIRWEIVLSNDKRMKLVSELVLDSQPINYTVDDIDGVKANTYEFSTIREWLNNHFYNTAFSENEKKLICDSTSFVSCINSSTVKDFVFLPSVSEIENYYFKPPQRCKLSTDYSKYQGVYITKYPDWFLRTPSETTDTDNYFIDGSSGNIEEDLVIYTNGGIVPTIMIKR